MKAAERLQRARMVVHGLLDAFIWNDDEPGHRQRESLREMRRLAAKLFWVLFRP